MDVNECSVNDIDDPIKELCKLWNKKLNLGILEQPIMESLCITFVSMSQKSYRKFWQRFESLQVETHNKMLQDPSDQVVENMKCTESKIINMKNILIILSEGQCFMWLANSFSNLDYCHHWSSNSETIF